MLKEIEVRIASIKFSIFKLMVEGLENINVVEARIHLDKMLVLYFFILVYEMKTRSSQETYSFDRNEYS
jgi:hypothetical protein